ncbi:MAG: 2-dehydropantoate 2-reductase [Alphaproteobacteria bacterium]|nr:2-dehydropantoate 2-reductase [Alphaproteobacteria bacterium]
MKVCVYGAGAIGAHLAVLLHGAGVDVSVIARGPHLEAIKENGLKLIIGGQEKLARLPAAKDPTDLGPQDYVIVAVKSHQAWDAAEHMLPLLGPETHVVTAQNGVPWWYFYGLKGPWENKQLDSVDPEARQWNLIGPQRAIGCTVYPAAEITQPGVITHTYGDRYNLGEPSGEKSQRVMALAAALEAADLKCRVYDQIRDDIWLKLWGNLCFNPISALTHATLDIVATDPGTRRIAHAMMTEAETLARKMGIDFRVDIERRINGAASVGAHRTSMLQDLEKGRKLELDALLTAVQEMGRLVEVPTPMIDTVLALTQQMGRFAGVYPVFPELEGGMI